MTAVGWLGLGKLGVPCALALAKHGGHRVTGYDPDRWAADILAGRAQPPAEAGIGELLGASGLRLGTLAQVVADTDGVVFIAVQTPHDPSYGGEQPMPDEPADFDYSYLVQAVRDLEHEAAVQHKQITAVVISTMLPGTMRARLFPLTRHGWVKLIYSPYFIAMGTVIEDFLNPEFVLVGADDPDEAADVTGIYRTVHDQPLYVTSIESAELLKVAYNCFISMKITFANMVAEICERTGADCDEITGGLELATRRIISPAYLRGGMGDGGACHPRDNMAMSWLARRLGLSVDLMGFVSNARERQSQWLAGLVAHHAKLAGLPVVILGKSFKPGIRLTQGSPALLLGAQLAAMNLHPYSWDPHVDSPEPLLPDGQCVFVVATQHPEFQQLKFAPGSVVIDPFGYMPPGPGIVLVTPGRKT